MAEVCSFDGVLRVSNPHMLTCGILIYICFDLFFPLYDEYKCHDIYAIHACGSYKKFFMHNLYFNYYLEPPHGMWVLISPPF